MTSRFMVVALGEDGLSKGGVREYIDTALVGEDPLGILPVRETRAEGGGNRSIH